LGGVTDKAGGLGKSAKGTADGATKAAGETANKAKEASAGLPGGDALNGVPKEAGDAGDKAKGLAGDAAGQALDAPNKVKGITGDVVAEPESIFSEDATKTPGDAADKATTALGQGKDAVGGALGQAQDTAGSLAGKTKGGLGQAQDTVSGLTKQGTHASGQVTCLVGKRVNDAEEVVDESGQVLSRTAGDVSSMGKSDNKAGEIVDTGKVVGRVSHVAEGKGQDVGALIKGFTPDTGGSGSVNAHGIQISVQTTKDGMSLTINIPGSFQQQ
jgi:hypothetical protein